MAAPRSAAPRSAAPRSAAPRSAGAERAPRGAKRALILRGAAELFGSRPFDEVRLDDLAQLLHIGKGTIYLYFASKEALYSALLLEGVNGLLERMRAAAAEEDRPAWTTLEALVREMVHWARANPHFFHLVPAPEQRQHVPGLRERRREISRIIEQVIRRGVATGELEDPHPELTALFFPGILRSLVRHGPPTLSRAALAGHMLRIFATGLRPGPRSGR